MDTRTAGPIAKDLGVTPKTIHQWAAKFADFLSDGANPSKGKTRRFTPRDYAVLSFVADESNANTSLDDIPLKLMSQVRHWEQEDMFFEFPEAPGQDVPQETVALVTRLQTALNQLAERDQRIEDLESELDTVKEELYTLRGQVKNVDLDTIIDLQKQIAVLEYRLEESEKD